MHWLALLIPSVLLAAAVAGCDAPQDTFRLVTVESQDQLGLSLRELPEATLKSIGLGYGVNETRIHSLQEFSSALAQPRDGRLSLLVRRGKADVQVPLEGGTLPSEDGVLRMPRPATDTLLRT